MYIQHQRHNQQNKHSISVHVNVETTYWGVTTLKFVTGIHKQARSYVKANQTGVACAEFQDVLEHHSWPQGNSLFAAKWTGSWQLQQDNATCHKVAHNMEFISQHVPGGDFLLWQDVAEYQEAL